ncbi:Cytochrome c2 [Flavobacterium gillisiae]|uniref:Cytochrome c2 n=1 Tax=Flavobacterium gillisiae TaxID=150146 RepID=A0A1H4CS47_9FLAO|nr:cytochrome c [Flavobacterium gillisiae]SEA63220.1 Cytochrome c2 [Flavobacterium gillisiae]
MRQFQYKIVILILFLTLGCQQKTQNKTDAETNIQSHGKDSLTIDLVALQNKGQLKKTTLITVYDDPVYHSIKRYNAIPFPELLETYTSIKNLETSEYQIVFECEDGYKPMMPLQKFISVKSFLAVSDLDAPKGQLWLPIIKDGHEMKAAPFYLIYQEVSTKDVDFKWPYNLIKIHLVPNSENIALLFPKDDAKAEIGFQLFSKNCVTCHSINKIGGNMGPELNYPKSVTEYWDKTQLKAFIKNPASFRNGVKMPTPTNLTTKEIDEIVNYLEYMTNHKL